MNKSVSNDALWEKLSEIDKKLEKLSETQRALNLSDNPAIIKPDFQQEKDEIITKIKDDIRILGLSSDSHFDANRKNIEMLDENLRKVLNIVSRIRKQQRETSELQKTDNSHFNFRFFKIKKSSLIIAILGLLVFILTLFCIKQQNDYTLLMNEYYRQSIIAKEVRSEIDSLNMQIRTYPNKRRK